MLKKTVDRLLRHRHFWRDVGFDELSELYISTFFRGLSISITGLFVPIYLFRLGFPLTYIFLVFASYFSIRLFTDFAAAYTVARIGPKHTMLIGNFLQIIALAMFLSLTKFHWPLWLVGMIWGSSASYYFIPFHVDFSKVKHAKHGGKELGYVNIMDKIGGGVGPLLGGIVAALFGAQYIFLVAIALLIMSTIVLFRTPEPVRVRQKLNFRALPINKLKRDFQSVGALGIENTLCVILWPLYIAMFIVSSESIYIKVGLLASLSVVIAVITAWAIGKLIDDRRGRSLLRYSATTNGLLHLARPFAATFPVAAGISLLNEVVTVGYRMPYWKGAYDAADDLPGLRIVYLSSMEAFASVCKAAAWWLLLILAWALPSGYVVVVCGFALASLASFMIMKERFKALDSPQEYNKSHE